MSRPSHYPHEGGGAGSRPSIFLESGDSAARHRQSFAPPSAAPGFGSTSAAARLQAKRHELEGLMVLKEQSARLARDVEKLGNNVDALVEGGEAVAAVMQSWAGVFRAMQIAQSSLNAKAAAATDVGNERDAGAVPPTLVRLPVDGGERAAAPHDTTQPDADET